jgi:hypothetical protein
MKMSHKIYICDHLKRYDFARQPDINLKGCPDCLRTAREARRVFIYCDHCGRLEGERVNKIPMDQDVPRHLCSECDQAQIIQCKSCSSRRQLFQYDFFDCYTCEGCGVTCDNDEEDCITCQAAGELLGCPECGSLLNRLGEIIDG